MHDIYATLAGIVGVDLAQDQALDSFDLGPLILDNGSESAPVRDHMIQQGVKGEETWAYREGHWKLILDGSYRALHLFDLSTDLSESDNLINDPRQATRIAEMQEQFIRRRNADRTAP